MASPTRSSGAGPGRPGDGGEAPGPASDEERREALERRRRKERLEQIKRDGKKRAVTPKQIEARRQRHWDEDLTFLSSVGVTGYAVPADAAEGTMLDELSGLGERYRAAEALEAPPFTVKQRELAERLFRHVDGLADALRAVLGVPDGQSARWASSAVQAADNAALADLVNRTVHPPAPPADAARCSTPAPGLNAYGRREAELSAAPLPDGRPRDVACQPDFTPGKIGLHQLLCELEFMRAFGPDVVAELKAQQGKRGWLTGASTPLNILCGRWLPALYARWMGGRKCEPSYNDHAEPGSKANPDTLFLTEAAKRCGRTGATPYSVYQAYRRLQRAAAKEGKQP